MYEDVDWSLRAKRCGYDLRIVPASKIKHKASTSFGGPRSPMQIYYHIRNQHLCFERNYPLKQRIIFHKNRMRRDFKSLKKTIKILTAYSPVDKAIRQAYLDYCFRRFFARDYRWHSALRPGELGNFFHH
jgi:GT2 family glycosyltransferase